MLSVDEMAVMIIDCASGKVKTEDCPGITTSDCVRSAKVGHCYLFVMPCGCLIYLDMRKGLIDATRKVITC